MSPGNPPKTRDVFENDIDELHYLYSQIDFYLNVELEVRKALDFKNRFEVLIEKLEKQLDGTITIVESKAMLADLNGDPKEELKWRKIELEMVRVITANGTQSIGAYDKKYLELTKSIVEHLCDEVAKGKSKYGK